MKKSILTLFFIFLVVILCGCSKETVLPEKFYEKNAIRIIREIEKDGQIKMTYTFPSNTEKFKLNGLSDKEQKIYKFYFASYINSLAEQYKNRANGDAKVSACTYFSDIDAFGFSINFKNQNAQSEYYEQPNNSSNSFVLKSKFFINIYLLKTSFPISTQTSAQNFLAPARFALQETSKECDISQDVLTRCLDCLNDTIFIYDFSSAEAQIKSKTTYVDGEKQHNFFAKSISDIEKPIEFYYIVPNKPVWYISALIFVLLGIFISLFALKRKKNNQT